jgi:predicted phage terminase large subunit-like protein
MSEEIRAQPGPQSQALSSPADILVLGGARGGGKSWTLLVEPLRHIGNPDFGAVILRQTFPQIMVEGGLWDEARKIYPFLGATPNLGRIEWKFPSGARVRFSYLQSDQDTDNYLGAQIPLLEFDQAEQFSAYQFFTMLGANRSTCGVRPYCRMSCNPDPDSFLAGFIAWWIADDGYADIERAGRLRWFVRIADHLHWADSPAELQEQFGLEQRPMSVTFIPASVYENPILLGKDPDYLSKLMALLPVDRERMLGIPHRGGNWTIRPEAGKVFNRTWFEVVDAVPTGGVECRFWDFAATEKKMKGPEPAFTAGVRMRLVGGVYYVTGCVDVQAGPAEADQLFERTSRQDLEAAKATGTRYLVRWEEEGGASGKRDSARLVRMLAGLDVGGVSPQGDKLTRAKPLAVQGKAGNVKLLRGPWNERWLSHMHDQPDIKEKDIMDASSGAFHALTGERKSWIGVD